MIAVQDLVKEYGRFKAVDGVTFDVRPGEIHGFLGPNGAGKTTTMRMIAGLLKPTSGRILVDNHDLEREPEAAKGALGFIPDRPFIYDKLTAGEFLTFHAGLYGFSNGSVAGRVREMLNDGGLYLNHGITHEFHWKPSSQTDFLYKYVFPNGDLAGLTETMTEQERAGWEILDVEGLRLHYARTCRQWVERLEARADEARALVGERVYRIWRLYLTCSSVAFQESHIGLYQVLMRKQWDRAFQVPTTREDLYRQG